MSYETVNINYKKSIFKGFLNENVYNGTQMCDIPRFLNFRATSCRTSPCVVYAQDGEEVEAEVFLNFDFNVSLEAAKNCSCLE